MSKPHHFVPAGRLEQIGGPNADSGHSFELIRISVAQHIAPRAFSWHVGAILPPKHDGGGSGQSPSVQAHRTFKPRNPRTRQQADRVTLP
jgi:hypothetical protein